MSHGFEPVQSANPVEDFFKLSKVLMVAIHEVFPDCELTNEARLQLDLIESSGLDGVKVSLIEKWYETLKPHFAEVARKNDNSIARAKIDILDKLDIKTKWAEFEHEEKEIMWNYIHRLTALAIMHHEGTPEHHRGLASAAAKLTQHANLDIKDGKFHMEFSMDAFEQMLGDPSVIENALPEAISAISGGEHGGFPGLNEMIAPMMQTFKGALEEHKAQNGGKIVLPNRAEMEQALGMLGAGGPAAAAAARTPEVVD